MKFRNERIDDVRILEAKDKEELTRTIMDLGQNNVIIDLQYGTSYDGYSALILLRKK